MKKSLIAFLCTFIALPAVADNYIKFKASAIEDTINTMVPETHRGAAADEYQKQMDQTTGKISVMGIYKVCAAAGFDINNTNGYNGCRLFINTIAEKSGFGSGSATQQNCRTKFNGIWSLSPDGKQYQCVGKDGHKLVYSASCHGGDGKCIRDFASLQTQVPTAKEFIYAYGKKHEIAFTCSNEKVDIKKIGDDYIKCSAGGVAYEFQFDDLNQDPGQTAVESENTALCEMFGGKIVKHPDSSIEKQWQSCEVSRENCNGPLHNLAIKIGHNVMYQGYCRLSRQYKFKSQEELQTLPGVDSYVFYNSGAQMRADMAVTQTEEYLRTMFPHETYINCNPGISLLRDYSERPVIDIQEYDYIMHCTVGSKQVDFVFDDLTETMDYAATSGEAKMACAILGARVDGKNCRDLTDFDCTELGKKLQERGMKGTDYVPEKGGCILLDAQTEDHINLGIEVAGGLVATYLTGGVGLVVSIVSIGTDLGFEQLNQWLRKIPYNDYQEFMKHANKCSDTDTSIENQYCVADVLNTYHALIMGNMSDLAPEIQAQASEKLQKMIKILSDKDIISTVSPDNIPTLKQGRNYVSMAALGFVFIINPDKLATKGDDLIRQATKMGKTINNIDNIVDTARMFGRTNLDDIGVYSKGWQQHAIDGDIRFKIKKITYPGEADDVKRALEAGLSGSPNQAFLGVKDDYIYITYKSDLKTTGPIFDNFIKDTARMFGRTNVDDIGMIDKGWERAVFDGVDRFRHKKITYPEEADDVRRALEATKGQHNLAYMGVKDGYIVIAYESDLERAWPAFNKAVSDMTDAARTTSRTTNTAVDTARMFGRTNVDDIGMIDKGWERAVFDGVDRFRHKKITYPEEADDVRRALEATKGQHNLAYMGVKDGYIVIAYESDLERARPAFNKAVSGMTDAARTTSRITNTAVDGTRIFGRTNLDDIGVYSKGWQQHAIDGDIRFKIKKITYPGEADDVKRALEAGLSGSPNQAFLGVKDDYIYITYKSDLKTTGPIFDNFMKDTARMFGRTNLDDIGVYSKGWQQHAIDGDIRFKIKKITYPGEADDVKRALEAGLSGSPNQAFLGVKDDYIYITYKSDLKTTGPIFDNFMKDAAHI